jgi:hypothetical protein
VSRISPVSEANPGPSSPTTVRLLYNGVAQPWLNVTSSFATFPVAFPGNVPGRWRAELYISGTVFTVTSYIFAV